MLTLRWPRELGQLNHFCRAQSCKRLFFQLIRRNWLPELFWNYKLRLTLYVIVWLSFIKLIMSHFKYFTVILFYILLAIKLCSFATMNCRTAWFHPRNELWNSRFNQVRNLVALKEIAIKTDHVLLWSYNAIISSNQGDWYENHSSSGAILLFSVIGLRV